jgi:hypothetical protein
VVRWAEGAERAIARGRDRVELGVVVVGMAVQGPQSGEAAEAEATSSVGAAVAGTEAAVAVEARRTGADPGAVEVEEVPTSAEAGQATSARSAQTQS